MPFETTLRTQFRDPPSLRDDNFNDRRRREIPKFARRPRTDRFSTVKCDPNSGSRNEDLPGENNTSLQQDRKNIYQAYNFNLTTFDARREEHYCKNMNDHCTYAYFTLRYGTFSRLEDAREVRCIRGNLFLTMAPKYKLIQCTLTSDDSSEAHSRE